MEAPPVSSLWKNDGSFKKQSDEVLQWRFIAAFFWTAVIVTAVLFFSYILSTLSYALAAPFAETYAYEDVSLGLFLSVLAYIFVLIALLVSTLTQWKIAEMIGSNERGTLARIWEYLRPSHLGFIAVHIISAGVLNYLIMELLLSDQLPALSQEDININSEAVELLRTKMDFQWNLLMLIGPVTGIIWTANYVWMYRFIHTFTNQNQARRKERFINGLSGMILHSAELAGISLVAYLFVYFALIRPVYNIPVEDYDGPTTLSLMTPRLLLRLLFCAFHVSMIFNIIAGNIDIILTEPFVWKNAHILESIDTRNSPYVQRLGWLNFLNSSLNNPNARKYLYRDNKGMGWLHLLDRITGDIGALIQNLKAYKESNDKTLNPIIDLQIYIWMIEGITKLTVCSLEEDVIGSVHLNNSVPRLLSSLSELSSNLDQILSANDKSQKRTGLRHDHSSATRDGDTSTLEFVGLLSQVVHGSMMTIQGNFSQFPELLK